MNINIELLTEILDLAAGISVAPEIIGKERLEAIRHKFITLGMPIRSKDFTGMLTAMYGKEKSIVYKPVAYGGLIFAIVMQFLSPTKTIIQAIGLPFAVWLRLVLALPLLVLYYWLWLLVLTVSVFVAELLIDGILGIALWVSNKATLSKLLLVFGFALFIISKAIKILVILNK